MSLADFAVLLGRLLAGWLDGSRNIWRTYILELEEISERVSFLDLLTLPLNPGAQLEAAGIFLDIVEATQELAEDLGLLWPRLFADEVEVLVPLPKKFANRLFRGDQAVGWVLEEFLQTAIDVADLDAPALIDAISFSARMKGYLDAISAILDANLRQLDIVTRGAVIKAVIGLVLRLMTAAGIGLIIVTLWIFVSRIWSETELVLAQRALPQDSRRIRARRPRRRQFRVNRRTGADRP